MICQNQGRAHVYVEIAYLWTRCLAGDRKNEAEEQGVVWPQQFPYGLALITWPFFQYRNLNVFENSWQASLVEIAHFNTPTFCMNCAWVVDHLTLLNIGVIYPDRNIEHMSPVTWYSYCSLYGTASQKMKKHNGEENQYHDTSNGWIKISSVAHYFYITFLRTFCILTYVSLNKLYLISSNWLYLWCRVLKWRWKWRDDM